MARNEHSTAIPERLYTTGEIARYCHTTVMQVNRWIKNNDLQAFRYPGGHYRIPKEEFRAFLARNSMPVVEKFFKEKGMSRILVADDDRNLADAVRLLLQKHRSDFDVEVAYDGYETLIKAGDFKPDLLILDIRMPKLDGLEICRRLRQNSKVSGRLKILAITGHYDAYDRETVLATGANEYLLKPFEMQKILEKVEELLK